MAKVKLGVFGAGRGMAMITQILGSKEAELVAVCDKFEPGLESVKKAAEDAGMKIPVCYTSFDEFINHEMDGVVLANYANEHAPYAIRLLDKGIHVMSDRVFDVMEEYLRVKGLPLDESVGTRFPIMNFYMFAAEKYPIYGVLADKLEFIDVGKLDALKPAEDFVKRHEW